jgi:hypothetical protein
MKNVIMFVMAGAALAVACNTNAPKAPVEGVSTTGAGVVSNDDTARRLTEAACDYAAKCNRFGKDKDYADEAGCKSEVSHKMESDYKPSDCPHGVKQERLASCINDFKNEACGNVPDKISRLEACRTGELCIK